MIPTPIIPIRSNSLAFSIAMARRGCPSGFVLCHTTAPSYSQVSTTILTRSLIAISLPPPILIGAGCSIRSAARIMASAASST